MSLKPQIRRLPNHFESFQMKPDHGNLQRPENACIGILEIHSFFNFFKYESILLVSIRLSYRPPPPKLVKTLCAFESVHFQTHQLEGPFTFHTIHSDEVQFCYPRSPIPGVLSLESYLRIPIP